MERPEDGAQAKQIETAIVALEAQRGNLGDMIVDTAVAPLRTRLAELRRTATEGLRLRQITVLFTDIVGSTALGATLDTEDFVAVVSSALASFGAIVESHGGRVARFTGDGLKGIFGADSTREDDAERAVQAGLAILDAARRHAATLREARLVSAFQVRVGINTGTVALGRGVEADNTAMGTAVNLAARLEQAAPEGGLLISQDTQALVRGLFDVDEQPAIRVKGHAEPLVTWLVRGARPREFRAANRGIAGLETRLVGREAELGRLLDACAAVAAGRQPRAVSVVGEAGVGKSRLLHEMRRRLREDGQGGEAGTTLIARADPQMRLQPYRLLRELVAGRLAIAEQDSADVARAKLRAGLSPSISEAEAELLGHLIGVDFSSSPRVAAAARSDARLLRDRGFRASLRWLQALPRPAIVLLDDVHWADQGSLDWIEHVLAHGDKPLLLVLLARPLIEESYPGWLDQLPVDRHLRIDLAPLGDQASADLADDLLRRIDGVPTALREALTEGAEGNPFYMEELVRMLVDDGVIVADVASDGARWRVAADRLPTLRVPTTLTAVLQARIDALQPVDRNALQQASVIGPVFWDAALDALEPEASTAIPSLVRRQMSVPHDASAFNDCREFAFSHHLLHQATYDTVLKPARRAGHARAAAWLSTRLHDRSGEYLAATADHFERASDRAQAAHYFGRAAHAAAQRFANDAALEHARRALDNVEAEAPERFELLLLRETVFDVLGQRDDQQACLDEVAGYLELRPDPRREAEVMVRRALLSDRQGMFAQAAQFAARAYELATASEAWVVAARAAGEQAMVMQRSVRIAEARDWAKLGHEHAHRSGDELIEAQMLVISAMIENAAGKLTRAIAYHRAALERARSAGNLRLEALILGNLAGALLDIGDDGGALVHAEAAVRTSREIGHRSVEANALILVAAARLEAGDAAGAIEAAERAVEIDLALGDLFHRGFAWMRMSDALESLGRLDEASAAMLNAQLDHQATGVKVSRIEIEARIAAIELAQGDAARALMRVEEVLVTPDEVALAWTEPHRVRWIAWTVLQAAGDPRAPAWLRETHQGLLRQAESLEDDDVTRRFLAMRQHRAIIDAWSEGKA